MRDKQTSKLLFNKLIGRSHVHNNRIDQAIQVYKNILEEYPDDLESLIFLGDCHLANRDYPIALKIFQKALKSAPDDLSLRGRIELALSEIDTVLPIPEWGAEAKIAEEIPGEQEPGAYTQEDFDAAESLFQEVLSSDRPATIVSDRLDQIEHLLPVLLSMNIQNAEKEGNPELAQALQHLQCSLQGTASTPEFNIAAPVVRSTPPAVRPASPVELPRNRVKKVLFLTTANHKAPHQITLAAGALNNEEYQVSVGQDPALKILESHDLLIFVNPHVDGNLMRGMAACVTLGKPMVVYMDKDFEHLPITHADYALQGLATPASNEAHRTAMKSAACIIVTNPDTANRLNDSGFPAVYIPEGWSPKNPFWEHTSPPRKTINIGWAGFAGDLDDILPFRRAIYRIMNEFAHVKLVICDNPEVYYLFDSLPPSRVEYLPKVEEAELPYQLSNIDIMIIPQRNTPFNQARSDLIFMAAGVKQIPWIASPLQPAKSWAEGGIFADTKEAWHTGLRQMILNEDFRSQLGSDGYIKGQTRKIQNLSKFWDQVISEVLDPSKKVSAQAASGRGYFAEPDLSETRPIAVEIHSRRKED